MARLSLLAVLLKTIFATTWVPRTACARAISVRARKILQPFQQLRQPMEVAAPQTPMATAVAALSLQEAVANARLASINRSASMATTAAHSCGSASRLPACPATRQLPGAARAAPTAPAFWVLGVQTAAGATLAATLGLNGQTSPTVPTRTP